MSSANISEERLRRTIRTYLAARSLFPGKLMEDYGERLFRRRFPTSKILAADRKTLKRVVTEEIRNFQNILEDFLRELERKRSAVDKDLVEVDKVVSAFPNIYRDGFTLKVDGKILSYEIDILSERVHGFCPGKHSSKGICVQIKEPSSCSSRRRENVSAIPAFPDIADETVRKSVQVAINLANDLEIDDLRLLHEIYDTMMCPKCIKEKKIPKEILEQVCDRIIMLEEQKAKKRKKERPPEHREFFSHRLYRFFDELLFDYELDSLYE